METNMDELRRLAGVSESDDDMSNTPWMSASTMSSSSKPNPVKCDSDEEKDCDMESDEEETKGQSGFKEAMKQEDEEGESDEGSTSEEDESEDDDDNSDEEEESGEEEEESENEMEEEADDAEAGSSSESDGESEKCPVCLGRFQGQDIGTPESCDHTFCLECIQEWSKNVNTCPVDRQVFHIIFVRHEIGGKIFKQITVADRRLVDEEEEDPTDCEICGRSDREDRLLLCDGCDLGYHCECLEPPIDQIPVDEWFCPDCMNDRNQAAGLAEAVDDTEEIMYMINENQMEGLDDLPVMRPQRRQVARTRQSERVRAAIQTLRERRARVRPIIRSDESSQDEADEDEAVGEGSSSQVSARASTSAPRKKTTRRKVTRRKTTKKRRTTRKKKTVSKTKSGKRKKRRTTTRRKSGKRKTKGKKGKTKRHSVVKQTTPVTVKSRLATKLGLSKPPPGRTIPLVRAQAERSMDLIRSDTGITSLSILGERDSLDFFGNSDDEGMPTAVSPQESVAVASVSRSRIAHKYSKSAMKSHRAIGFRAAAPRRKKIEVSAPVQGSSSCDLLGQIMEGQTMLQMEGKDVIIRRDGSLQANQMKGSPSKAGKNNHHSDSLADGTDSPSQGGSEERTSEQNQDNKETTNSNDNSQTGGSSGDAQNADVSGGSGGTSQTAADGDAGEAAQPMGVAYGDGIEDISQAESESEADDASDEASKQHGDKEFKKSESIERNDNTEPKESDEKTEHDDAVPSIQEKSEDGKSDVKEDKNATTYDPFSPIGENTSDGNEDDDKANAECSGEESKVSNEEGQADEDDADEEAEKASTAEDEEEEEGAASGEENDAESGEEVQGEDDAEEEEEADDEKASEIEEQEETVDSAEKAYEDDDGDEADNDDSDEKPEEIAASRIPISELPRIPKIKKKPKEEDIEDDDTEDSSGKRSVLSRLDTRVREQTYPKWEKKDRRDRRREESGERSPEYTKNDESSDRSERSRSDRHRDRDYDKYDRDRSEKSERSRERDDSYRSSRKRKRRSRSRSRERNRDRYRRSKSRSRERSRRGGDRSRSRDRTTESRSRRSRNERSRSRERSDRSYRKERNSDRRSRSPRSSRYEERSRHRHDRERSENGKLDETYKDVKEERKRLGAGDYKASVKLFSQSLKESKSEEDSSSRFGKIKRTITQIPGENSKRRKTSDEEDDDDDDCAIIAVEIKPPRPVLSSVVNKPKPSQVVTSVIVPPEPTVKPLMSSIVKPPEPAEEEADSSSRPSKHISFKIETDRNRLGEGNALQKLDSKLSQPAGQTVDKAQDDVVSSSDAVESAETAEQKPDTEDLDDDGAKDNNDTDMDLDEGSYDPCEPTEDISPPPSTQPAGALPPGLMTFRVGEAPVAMPPRPLMPPEEFAEQGLLEGGRPPLPPGMMPGNLVMHPTHRLGMMPPHGVPPNVQVMPPNMVVNSLLMNRPPPFGRLARMPPPRMGWQMNHPPPNVFIQQQQNSFVPQVTQPPGLIPHQNGVEALSIDPRSRPPFQQHLMHANHQPPQPQPRLSQLAQPGGEVPMTSHAQPSSSTPQQPLHQQVGHQPPQAGAMPTQQQQKEHAMNTSILPLAPKAVDQLKEITKLLSTQAKLAELGKQKKLAAPSAGVFKTPEVPPATVSTTSAASSTSNKPGTSKSANKSGADTELFDMDVASPTEDDDLLMSFSPPPEIKWESKSDKKARKPDKKQRHHRHHGSASQQQKMSLDSSEKEKIADSTGQDDVPISAVELDKQTKLMKKLNHRERVVEEVKLAIKPYYAKGKIDKDDYKEIMRKAVPKVCHSKSGDINPVKIKTLVEAYVTKVRGLKKYKAKHGQK